MRVSREQLVAVFASLDTDELMARHASGTLTDTARKLAEKELQRRGITPRPRSETAEIEATEESDPLETVAAFLTSTEAYVFRGLLETEGIHAVVADGQTVQMNEFMAPALGGVRVLVPHSAVSRAHEIKTAIARGDYRLDEDTDVREE